jgi:uncharacterized membrane protein YoaK (UPF0700 family)
VQRLGVAGVSTVVVTGTLTTAILRLVDGKKSGSPAKGAAWLPAASWGAYFLGAIVGGLQSIVHAPLPILLPGLLLLAVAATAARSRLGA